MLCQFSFKNFKSYRDTTVLDMQATSIKEFRESLITFEKDKKTLLPISVLYGPNGGGKSNVLEAIRVLTNYVMSPVLFLKEESYSMKEITKAKPFRFDPQTSTEPTEFEIFFRVKGDEFRYNLSIYQNRVVEEYLYRLTIGAKKPEMLFARYDGKIDIGKELKNSKVSTSVNEEMAYLSFIGVTYDIHVINNVIKWFMQVVNVDNTDFESEACLSIFHEKEWEPMKEIFLDMLKCLGIDIIDYRIVNEEQIYTKHIVNGTIYELNLSEESKGTKKLFSILPIILTAIIRGCLVVVDELDSRLHPKLLRYIIHLFSDPRVNKQGGQLIFTSHDLSTMKGNIFRRDEIWFAAKDENESSQIYSLYDIRDEKNEHIKSTATFDKQYMEGRYGADPYLREMLNWEVAESE